MTPAAASHLMPNKCEPLLLNCTPQLLSITERSLMLLRKPAPKNPLSVWSTEYYCDMPSRRVCSLMIKVRTYPCWVEIEPEFSEAAANSTEPERSEHSRTLWDFGSSVNIPLCLLASCAGWPHLCRARWRRLSSSKLNCPIRLHPS